MGAKPQKFGAGSAVLEDFGHVFEKIWLKNAIEVNFLDLQKIFRMPLKKRLEKGDLEGLKKISLKH